MPDPTTIPQDNLHWAVDDLGNAFLSEEGVIAVPVHLDFGEAVHDGWALATVNTNEDGLIIHALLMNEDLLTRLTPREHAQAFRFRGEPVRRHSGE